MLKSVVAAAGLSLLAGCARAGASAPVTLSEIEFRTVPGSGEPNLSVHEGEMLLSWFEPDGDGQALRFAVHDGTAWSGPQTITTGRDYFVNWADFPSLARLGDGQLLVHWLERTAASTYAYHVMLSRSADGGQTWSDPVSAHEDQSPTEHGFVSVVASPEGGADLMWLDGQNTGGEHGGAMQVRSRAMSANGAAGPELLVDGRACDCCQTALVRTASGLLAAYRDRSEEEIRDIAVSRLTEDGWSEPLHVGDDNWYFPACPVNGPSLSASGDHVAIAWFAQPDGNARVQVAFTRDGGRSFGSAIRVDEGSSIGRVDIELLAPDAALVSWLERDGEEGRIWARRVTADGQLGDPWLIAETDPNRRSGFPRMIRVGEDVVFAWSLVGDTGGVRVARLTGVAAPD